LILQEQINNSWSMDFMCDNLMGIHKFRTFNVMNDCSRGRWLLRLIHRYRLNESYAH
jgi:hypothetical protein